MRDLVRPTRRAFLQSAGAVSLLSGRVPVVSVEYLAAQDSIGVFRSERGRRLQVQSVLSRRPRSLVPSPNRRFLFAVNDITEYRGIPAGSVESYAVDTASGQLELISRQALSLSATGPTHLALSSDGRFMVVAAFGGGIYNVLPVREDGEIGSVTYSVKEIGMSVHPQKQLCAHPHSVAFHPSGKFVIGTDFGSDRINVFEFRDGCLHCVQRVSTPSGSGPAHLTVGGSGSVVRVEHALTSSWSSYRFDPEKAWLSQI